MTSQHDLDKEFREFFFKYKELQEHLAYISMLVEDKEWEEDRDD